MNPLLLKGKCKTHTPSLTKAVTGKQPGLEPLANLGAPLGRGGGNWDSHCSHLESSV